MYQRAKSPYASAHKVLPNPVKCHSVRSVGTLWVALLGVPLTDICAVATWNSPSMFSHFYRINVVSAPNSRSTVVLGERACIWKEVIWYHLKLRIWLKNSIILYDFMLFYVFFLQGLSYGGFHFCTVRLSLLVTMEICRKGTCMLIRPLCQLCPLVVCSQENRTLAMLILNIDTELFSVRTQWMWSFYFHFSINIMSGKNGKGKKKKNIYAHSTSHWSLLKIHTYTCLTKTTFR